MFLPGFVSKKRGEGDEESSPVRGFEHARSEKFNFDEEVSPLPGDVRGDIPTLPQIETSEDPNVVTSDRKSQSYFDIMSDFFDEPRIDLAPKNIATRQANFGQARPQLPAFHGQQRQLRQQQQLNYF